MRILLVEDERAQREALAHFLTRCGYTTEAVASGEEALERLGQESFSVVITDLSLPGMDGLSVVRLAREIDEELCLLLITAYASVDSAVEALRVGAHDYLLKPLIPEDLARKVAKLLAHQELLRENASLRRLLQASHSGPDVIAESQGMKKVLGWADRASRSASTVLLTGETGTGKEVVARVIHRSGPRSEMPFLAVNIAAIPDQLVESELFGHEKGAFTGADQRREGILRTAAGGTVFLDECAELALPVQAKLLRALEANEVRPLGRDTSVPFSARIVTATHQNLVEMVAKGTFREDLYYRLNVIPIHLPPLRERPEDIPGLVRSLLRRHARQSCTTRPAVTAEAMRMLSRHQWRGNVRELSNVLERALMLAEGETIGVDELPPDIQGASVPSLGLQDAVSDFERTHISKVLRMCGGNRERAAGELGVSAATLYRRLERLGLKGPGAASAKTKAAAE